MGRCRSKGPSLEHHSLSTFHSQTQPYTNG